jgi:hypothetical protein
MLVHVLLLILALLVPCFLACGKRGDPLPPRRKTPPSVTGVKVAQRGDQLEIAFQAPSVSVDGLRLPQLDLEVFVAQGEGDFEKLAVRHKLKAEPGESVVDRVPIPAAGTTVRVAVRALAGNKASSRSPVTGLVSQTPPIPPRALTATLVAEGVALAWKGARPEPVKAALPTPTVPGAVGSGPRPPGATPPAGTPAPDRPGPAPAAAPARTGPGAAVAPVPAAPPPFPGGFSIYRRVGAGPYTTPLTAPTEVKAFTDTAAPLGQTGCYVVRAVASREPLVESSSSEEACVAVADVAAPGTPAGLTILPVAEGLELSWSPSPEADLAGYRVLRSTGPGTPEQIAEVPPNQTQYVDKTAGPAVVYFYRLVAFDQAGNASPQSDAVEGVRP